MNEEKKALLRAAALFKRLMQTLTPPPLTSVSEWAETNRVISAEEAASPGPWFNDRVPYGVEIMNAIGDPTVRRVVVMSGTQMGKTNLGILNPIGYFIDNDPCPIMVVQPTITMAETFSGKRLTPMLRDTACLRDKVSVEKSRSAGNTILEKSFPGGYIVIAGANSAPSLKSRPVRVILFDEVDEAPANLAGQGDPVDLAAARADAFPNRKIVLTSTPTVKGESRIEAAYNDSSRERWTHLCPSCGERSPFSWRRLDFETAKMQCPYCQNYYGRRDWEKNGGQWIAENPERGTRGFRINALDSSISWEELIEQFAEANRLSKTGNHSRLITFINTKLAETWEERGEAVEDHKLIARREIYGAEIPDGVCVLTLGVDVQDSRLAYEVVGWGMGFESWGIDYGEIWGDPRQGGVWNRIDDLLAKTWFYGNGKGIRISRAAVDTGGHMTPQVYAYCKAREARGVYAIKGQGGDRVPVTRPSKNARERGLFIVGVDGIKADLFSWLKITAPGDGYCHFPKQKDETPINGYDSTYFAMLTAEKRVAVKDKRGFTKYEWHKTGGARNESLDCRVYSRAALRVMAPRDDLTLKRIYASEPWKKTEPSIDAAPQLAAQRAPPAPKNAVKPKIARNAAARSRGLNFYG